MQKSLSQFRSLPEEEIIQILGDGPLLVTHENEPRFVAQTIETFESMVRRLRALECASQSIKSKRPPKLVLLRPAAKDAAPPR